MFDGKAFGQEVVSVVKAHMEKALAPVIARMDAIERRLDQLPAPKDGKDADMDLVKQMIEDAIASVVIPDPIEPVLPDIPAMVEQAVSAIEKPKDGHSPTPEELAPLIDESVQRAVSAIPVPKDGKDGRDGCDAVDAMQDKDGNLVITFSDGRIKNVGPVCGKDGDPGKDGEAGKDGRDGFGFDDMDLVETEKGLFLQFKRGDEVKQFRLPVVVDRGVWKEQPYAAGDGVTWAGSFWIAQEETSEKPDSGKGWRLAVKRGRDGKDAPKETPEPKPVKFR